ncbi:hypothetical protein [Amycolatopsis sp. NPDC059657]|uniref:hypothetical protein n=1 Tax=Amycolatopsis sp. NPDC059657 TaxID=3346899 RepID=UPI00366DB442
MTAFQRYLANESAMIRSIGLWLRGRKSGVEDGGVAVPYVQPQKPMFIVFAAVTAVETAMLWLADLGLAIDLVLLVLGIYQVMLMVGLLAGNVTRPHVVSPRELRVRGGVFFDLRVPAGNIRSLRRQTVNHEGYRFITVEDDVLVLAVVQETNLIAEFHEPVGYVRPLGKTGTVRAVKFYADEPALAVGAFRSGPP